MNFLITVDVEADNQWKTGRPITLENIKYLSRFQSLCEKYGFLPTYLVSYEVANDPESVKIMLPWQTAAKAEIGAHLHPWTTPPFSEEDKAGQKRYPSELGDAELNNKLINLTDIIRNNFGVAPGSYRAGRWGLDLRQILIIKNLGYKIDCSITPKINWREINNDKNAPNFSYAKIHPYQISSDDIFAKGDSGILEAPMTILFTGWQSNENSLIVKKFLLMPSGLVKKVLNKLFFRMKWLRVFKNSVASDWKNIYRSAVLNNLPSLEFMIHSSELMPGGSPYAKTEEDIDLLYSRLDSMFAFFKDKKVESCKISDFCL